jgi:hypothetical protein
VTSLSPSSMTLSDARLAELIAATHAAVNRDFSGPCMDAHAADLDLALRELQQLREWQPIETGPKDGRTVLLNRAGSDRVYTGRYATCVDAGWWQDTHGQRRDPTHWKPLPAPPSEVRGTLAQEEKP